MLIEMIASGSEEAVFTWIELASIAIEVLAVVIIFTAVAFGTIRYLYQILLVRKNYDQHFKQYKHGLGKSLLLGLEILVAADVVRTVALEPTFENVLTLGLLVLIRTFLSWSLVVEIEGHWPWKPRPQTRDAD